MHVFHTFGVPPNNGKSNFAIIGCTENSKAALTNDVSAKRIEMGLSRSVIFNLTLDNCWERAVILK